MTGTACFLCGLETDDISQDFDTRVYFVRCRRCGEYRITMECSSNPRSADETTLAAISAATRQAAESHSTLLLRTDNWDQVAAAHKNTPVRQKVLKVLRYSAAKSRSPGEFFRIQEDFDYPAFDAASPQECRFLVSHATDSGYLESMSDDALTLTVKGWDAVEPLTGTAGTPGRCFVAMSFAEQLDEAYLLGIKPAVEQDCGLLAIRMKELHHNDDICDRLLSEIRQAQFVIADFTGHRNGVYYEAGFARALGRDVINCCRDTDFDLLHFDTNHLSHIKWKMPQDLRQQLTDRIRATIVAPAK
ncbi:MAG: nucleoside 2-deoxyribosyltransferase [Acidobacteriia bacterium]|nr:nucleoside 2-deoxyribosyltransferase [Terriglobia bacterium]